MRTPQEFEKIALWMGWKKIEPFGKSEVWKRPNGEITCLVGDKTSLTDAEAVEALDRLVEKGIIWNLDNAPKEDLDCTDEGIELALYTSASGMICGGYQPTIHEAVEAALLQLIAAELGKE